MPIIPFEYVSGTPETEIAFCARALVKYKCEPSGSALVVVAYQSDNENLALKAF